MSVGADWAARRVEEKRATASRRGLRMGRNSTTSGGETDGMLPGIAMSFLLNHPLVLLPAMALLLVAGFEIGHRVALRVGVAQDTDRYDQYKNVRDALGVLLGLLLGFMLSMAVGRFNHRRDLVVDEADAISTTYLRSQLLAEPNATRIHELLKKYVTVRMEFFDAGLDEKKVQEAEAETSRLQDELWKETVEATKPERNAISAAFVNSLNQTIDLDSQRLAAYEFRVPWAVWLLIVLVAFFQVFAHGATARKRFVFPLLASPLIVATACALIADLDASRSGLIVVEQRAMQRVAAQLEAGK